ncbi:unnamed protein product [Cylindrotheca closterium]|uniref:Helicase-associated domain-containing protein n=1 Tax=Cylindrotheca closterium TaxID=2856 RepID=A0AAD2FG85_9STRA|nr:unnamed protein product [Cylindrotheca closterium]CAJ1968002.1 unnamed protein product [Cylindrotheca closterium]
MTHQSRLDDERWKEYMKELQDFKQKFGHCKVPQKYAKLGQWVHHVRCAQKALQHGKPYSLKLTPPRIAELEAIGFVWGESRPAWNDHVEDLKQFRQQHGHTLVPANFPENTGLSKWVRRVRVAYSLMQQGKFKKGATIKLDESRMKQLKDVGFVWNTKSKNGTPTGSTSGVGGVGTSSDSTGSAGGGATATSNDVAAFVVDGTGHGVGNHDHDHDGEPDPFHHAQSVPPQHQRDNATTIGGVDHRISQGYPLGATARGRSTGGAHNKRRRTDDSSSTTSKLCPEGVRIQEELHLSQERCSQLEEQTREMEHKFKEQQEVAEFRRIQNEGLWDENEKLRREIADLKAGRLVFQHWNR